MSENNNRFKGIVGTVVIHLLALLAILFFALSTPLPLPGEEGVEVNLGFSNQGSGYIQEQTPPPAEQTPPPPQPASEPEPQPDEEIITQDVEEAPAIAEEEEVVEAPPPEKPKPVIKDLQDKEPELLEEEVIPDEVIETPDPVQTVNKRALYSGSQSNTDGDGSNQGITGQAGDQGKPTGVPGSDNYEGSGKGNEGVGFDLSGRGAKHLPKPAYNSEEVGKVVVEIHVDQNGKVVYARAGAKGTTISDLSLRRLAEDAARKSVFTPDPKAPEKQKGTITYNFIRLN